MVKMILNGKIINIKESPGLKFFGLFLGGWLFYVLVVLIGAKAKTTVKVKEVNGQAKKITSPSKPKVKTVKKVYSLPE